LREYLARFSEATIKVSNPNQEMFVSAFQNVLKVGHFNESLAQKPAISMQEIIKRVEYYIKGEESNVEKRTRDAWERDPTGRGNRAPNFYQQRRRPHLFTVGRSLIGSNIIKSLGVTLKGSPKERNTHLGIAPGYTF
jgi:hypothetical protein